MAVPAASKLRRRQRTGLSSSPSVDEMDRPASPTKPAAERVEPPVVWGKTPSGQVFKVPTTHDVLTLFDPRYPKSHFDFLNLFLLGSQLFLFVVLPQHIGRVFFLFYFALWRAAYDAGLGWVLTQQSKKKWIVRIVQHYGWLDEARNPAARDWIRRQLQGKMGKDYNFNELPLEYNAWLLFRQVVDVILLNDFVAYCMFAFTCFRVPEGLSVSMHIARWIGGIMLIAFNLWVKTEAHNVVKDYGWYWGDTFFQRGELVFDGVFELAPHPMYSVGYAGYYGLSLIIGSYPVLFVSLAAHAAQFAFLVCFENPHIERMYIERKPIAQRTPIPRKDSVSSNPVKDGDVTSENESAITTPAATEGSSASSASEIDTHTESESGTETEGEGPRQDSRRAVISALMPQSTRSKSRSPRLLSRALPSEKKTHHRAESQYDLLNKYFRRDAVLLHNIDLLRVNDAMLVLIITYTIGLFLMPTLSPKASLMAHFAHALAWGAFHSFGLGLLLRAQSNDKFMVRHFMKHYHYSQGEGSRGAVLEAFQNWKGLYNLSLTMGYVSFIGLAWKTYTLPVAWAQGDELLRHTLGALLVGLHIWTTMESYEVLGVFGWFFGDFFMEDFPANLDYTGIYRYLNNPEIVSGAAYVGLALVSNSKLVFAAAAFRYLANWWFLSRVENPHMRKLYGSSMRKEAGFLKVIKTVASKNARLLERRAGKHAPDIKRVAKEVRGTFEKVYEETSDVVEEWLAKSPKVSNVVQDTKVLLQQSKERLVITRVANDLSAYDTTKYGLSIEGSTRFHLGEPITVNWQAPREHSRRDWIGIYRVGANKSNLVTKVVSQGKWVPVHDEEWDGDFPKPLFTRVGDDSKGVEQGQVVFKSSTLPWETGRYELRYHHDGKYNVMAIAGPFEVYVDKPETLDFNSVRATLKRIVPLCLDSDPSLVPVSCLDDDKTPPTSPPPSDEEEAARDPDDFRFWNERQAKRICTAIQQAFEVEYMPQVVMADANLSTLANRILVSKEILTA